MSTIDMTQVAGLQAVNEEGQVIGTLSVDDLTELVATKIVQEAKNEAISTRSASVMSEASTIAATDEYEDQLELDTNPAYVRSLDSDGNPKRTATTSLATVVGGLLPSNGIERISTSANVSQSNPYKFTLEKSVYIISIIYPYTGGRALIYIVGGADDKNYKLDKIISNLPNGISLNINSNILTISVNSGGYGLSFKGVSIS